MMQNVYTTNRTQNVHVQPPLHFLQSFCVLQVDVQQFNNNYKMIWKWNSIEIR